MGGNLVFPRKQKNRFQGFHEGINSGKNNNNSNKWQRNTSPISKKALFDFYKNENRSINGIARLLNCSPHKIIYWLNKYKIGSRKKSEAMYLKHHPFGDPFEFHWPKTLQAAKLFGLGLGLYWGEGNRANKNSIRLGNTDSKLIKSFIRFLEQVYGISKNNLRFGLQIFSDVSPKQALNFWMDKLKVKQSQFQKVIMTPSRGRVKSKYGVLTVQFHNKKLRDVILKEIDNLK